MADEGSGQIFQSRANLWGTCGESLDDLNEQTNALFGNVSPPKVRVEATPPR